ncbi:MAG: lysophospholipid acyltransferase family protein [Candidatus Auribacterota bacterium]|nr:lysophospholipid acyltransferase family protein [Candidatus Auribacterota bacterium]
MNSDIAISLAASFAAGYSRLVGKTSHWEFRGEKPVWEYFQSGNNLIFAFWHSRFLMMPFLYRNYFRKDRMAVIVSQSRDGEIVGRFLDCFNIRSIRGSSSRGGKRAMVNLMRSVKDGWDVAVTPDGPRGPRYKVQDGILTLASVTGVPILPASYAASLRFIVRSSWDHFRFPFPASRIKLVFGEPLPVGKNLKDKKRAALRDELQRRLRKADREAEELIHVK